MNDYVKYALKNEDWSQFDENFLKISKYDAFLYMVFIRLNAKNVHYNSLFYLF